MKTTDHRLLHQLSICVSGQGVIAGVSSEEGPIGLVVGAGECCSAMCAMLAGRPRHLTGYSSRALTNREHCQSYISLAT